MTKINKTNVARLLDKAKVEYELIPYDVDENDLSAVHVAASLGEDIEHWYCREIKRDILFALYPESMKSI